MIYYQFFPGSFSSSFISKGWPVTGVKTRGSNAKEVSISVLEGKSHYLTIFAKISHKNEIIQRQWGGGVIETPAQRNRHFGQSSW